jgi:hypothetical protein
MKETLPYCTTEKAIKGYQESVIAKRETNDCVVRAFAASFDLPYDKAHKYVKEKFGRKDRQGTYGTVFKMLEIAEKKTQINYKKVNPIGVKTGFSNRRTLMYDVNMKGKKVKREMTVGTFIKQNPIGTFFILVQRHAFAIKDGIVIGNYDDSVKKRRVIKNAFEVK